MNYLRAFIYYVIFFCMENMFFFYARPFLILQKYFLENTNLFLNDIDN